MRRREFVRATLVGGGVLALGGSWSPLLGAGVSAAADSPYGPLRPPDGNGLALPAGFTSRVIATTGQRVPGSRYRWHAAPDGGATFAMPDGGWVYVSNSEVAERGGGVGMVRFDSGGAITDARSILTGTIRNCAGGPTPWGTWLSCEEYPMGRVWECDPEGESPAVVRPAMGRFNHEAAAVDPVRGFVYLTEDRPDGGLYRFRPNAYPDLSAGRLQILTETGGVLRWRRVPDPSASQTETRYQVPDTKRFNGGEGAWWATGRVWFTTKGDNRVWFYRPRTNRLVIRYDASTAPSPFLSGVDNLTVASTSGDVFVAEDGGNMEICLLVAGGAAPFLRLTGVSGSEMTGPAFDPSGTRLYFSSQRNPGRTYEVTGPFRT
ncbi:MAG: alkaline phosphatase PhoX [Acidimicrobiales bacterium]